MTTPETDRDPADSEEVLHHVTVADVERLHGMVLTERQAEQLKDRLALALTRAINELRGITPDVDNAAENVRGCSCGQADFGAPGHDGGPAIVGPDESEYRITYEVDVTAASPSQAARLAHEMMTDPTSLPPVLTVKHVASGETKEVDMHAE